MSLAVTDPVASIGPGDFRRQYHFAAPAGIGRESVTDDLLGATGRRAGRPQYFMARLAALVPTSQVSLTRYKGCSR